MSLGENGCYLHARVSFLKPTSISLFCPFPLSNRRACFISISVCVLLPSSLETTKEHQAFNFLIFPEQFFVLVVCFCFLSSGFPFLICHSQLTVPWHNSSLMLRGTWIRQECLRVIFPEGITFICRTNFNLWRKEKKSFPEQVLNYCLEIRCVPLTAVQRPKCLSPGSEPLCTARGDKHLGIQGSSGPARDLCIHPQQRASRRRECPSRGVRLRSPATGLPPLPKQSL